MNITSYPNNEIRIRIPPPAVLKNESGGGSSRILPPPAHYLSIVEKLRLEGATKKARLKKTGIERPGYGALPRGSGFSFAARRQIVRCGALLGTNGYQNHCLFLTGTLPGSTSSAYEAIARNSAWIVHELLTHIPRLAGVLPSECSWIWVWEFQKRGALHFHAVFQLPGVSETKRVLDGFTPLWNRVLKGVAKRSGVDVFEREGGGTWKNSEEIWVSRAEFLRKRADRYLAKYLGKECSKDSRDFFMPTRWYGINRSLLSRMRASVRVAQTHSCPADSHVVSDKDFDFLDYVRSKSHLERCFSDKVKTGFTFVFYVESYDEIMNEAERIFGASKRSEGRVTVDSDSELRCFFPAIEKCVSRADLFQRLQGDLGDYYRKLLINWLEDEDVDKAELFWIEYYARRLLFIQGISYKGQPPERSGVGLPSQNGPKIECISPPMPGFDQSSLFP